MENQTISFGCMKFSRNILNFIGEYCLEGVIASNLSVLTKILIIDDLKLKIFTHVFFQEFFILSQVIIFFYFSLKMKKSLIKDMRLSINRPIILF